MRVTFSFEDRSALASDPAAPSAGIGRFYGWNWSGRTVPKWKGPSGAGYVLSPHFGGNNIRAWRGGATIVATTFAATIGALPYTSASPTAPTIPQQAATNLLTQTYRSTISTGAAAGGIAFIRGNQTIVWRGNGVGLGGFMMVHRFALSALQTGMRAFVGVTDGAANPTNIDPLTATTPGCLGLAINASTGNWSRVNNTSGSARTAADLGSGIAVNATDLIELAIWCGPNDSGLWYMVTNLSTGAGMAGGAQLTANIPANTTFLVPVVWITNNATAAAATLDFVSTYVETDT